MSKTRTFVTLLSVTAMSWVLMGAGKPAGVAADTNLEILRDSIRANKKALVAASLDLTNDEAQKFWPVYDRYQKDLTALNDRYIEIIRDYTAQFANMTDDQAMKLLDAYLKADADRVKLRQDYVAQVAAVLPGRKVARFFQIENKMDAIARYDLAANIPVVKQ
jgi:hypothetical protein